MRGDLRARSQTAGATFRLAPRSTRRFVWAGSPLADYWQRYTSMLAAVAAADLAATSGLGPDLETHSRTGPVAPICR